VYWPACLPDASAAAAAHIAVMATTLMPACLLQASLPACLPMAQCLPACLLLTRLLACLLLLLQTLKGHGKETSSSSSDACLQTACCLAYLLTCLLSGLPACPID
jgi:hypothetical protein